MRMLFSVLFKFIAYYSPIITITYKDGSRRCYNLLWNYHNLNGPATVDANGNMVWYYNGMKHNPHGPADISLNRISYYIEDKLHREGDEPALITIDHIEFWKKGRLHREGKPALINREMMMFLEHGLLHNENGPAVYVFRSKHMEFYLWGERYDIVTYTKIVKFMNKRRRKLAVEYSCRWYEWLADLSTERGQRHAERQYQRYLEI